MEVGSTNASLAAFDNLARNAETKPFMKGRISNEAAYADFVLQGFSHAPTCTPNPALGVSHPSNFDLAKCSREFRKVELSAVGGRIDKTLIGSLIIRLVCGEIRLRESGSQTASF